MGASGAEAPDRKNSKSVSARCSEDGQHVTILVGERFDFNVHREFRACYKSMINSASEYTVDLTNTRYMDSSALGMLLLLREQAGGEKSRISIVNCCDDILKVLTISNFNKLFDVR